MARGNGHNTNIGIVPLSQANPDVIDNVKAEMMQSSPFYRKAYPMAVVQDLSVC